MNGPTYTATRGATDELIDRLITDCRLLGNALAANGETRRGAEVLNAMLALIRARDPHAAEAMDQERLKRAAA